MILSKSHGSGLKRSAIVVSSRFRVVMEQVMKAVYLVRAVIYSLSLSPSPAIRPVQVPEMYVVVK